VNALPFRGYNLIFDEWFRDQNFVDSVRVEHDEGPDDITTYNLLKRGKRHDYFTSCLPWPQKGPGVELPLGTSAPVYGNGMSIGLTEANRDVGISRVGGGSAVEAAVDWYNVNVGNSQSPTVYAGDNLALGVVESGESGMYADLTAAVGPTINSLRETFQLQKLLERDARGGTRYTEIIKSHFLVNSPGRWFTFYSGDSCRSNYAILGDWYTSRYSRCCWLSCPIRSWILQVIRGTWLCFRFRANSCRHHLSKRY